MATFLSRLILICTLSIPAFSFAITIPGNIHPERYTFFLTDSGGEMLREMNDAAVSVKLNNKVGFSAEAQSKAAAANISPLLYASSPLEQNFIRYDGKSVKALTCLVTTRTMPGQNKNYSWEETYCLDETGAAYIGTKGWPSRAIVEKSCEVGASGCPVYLGLNNDPPTMRNDAAQYIPYSSKRVSGQKESNSQPKPATGEIVAEQEGYVVSYVKGSSCTDNKLIVKNTSSGKTTTIAGLNGCSFDPKNSAVIIFPLNEYVGVYSGPTSAFEEIASVDLP
ncbi:hypothetical protein JVB16_06285 [Enterobacter hormaechei]|uniref:hypothetical protein n=1 Tax=Enterobacter hormaechei TaxID=158836 RepID=UPI00207591F3|nr:hypothetical protein [Enterobacter hormaechei]MCM7441827.1 hypothetical protein [Enterobacter hormaechei]MDG0827691.1 hypothetical protein [Enterobacter hormaechei]MDG0848579.1 hypothetical protein [Enterobacter hormaechei]